MPREAIPFAAADISALAKSLRAQLASRQSPPGHVEMLNILARAAGHRNFQHLRAREPAQVPASEPLEPPPEPDVDLAQIERVAGHFDAQGRMVRWPSKTSHQELGLWVIWAQLPAGRSMTEREVSGLIQALHLFGDHAILRRCLFNSGLLSRTLDCRDYRRIERKPPADAASLIRRVLRPRGETG